MTTQIIELEQKIQQLFDEGKLRDIRTVFDIQLDKWNEMAKLSEQLFA